MSKPSVIEYIQNRYFMYNESVKDIVKNELQSGKSIEDILDDILDILKDYDELYFNH